MRAFTVLVALVVLAVFSPMVRADVLFDLRLSEVESGRGDRDVFNAGCASETVPDRADFGVSCDREIPSERLVSYSVCTPEMVRLPRCFPQLCATSKGITPVPDNGADIVPISTFSHFVQLVKSTAGVESDATERVSEITRGILPTTSNMTLIGLFVFSFAGVFSVISISRIGMFGRTACE